MEESSTRQYESLLRLDFALGVFELGVRVDVAGELSMEESSSKQYEILLRLLGVVGLTVRVINLFGFAMVV